MDFRCMGLATVISDPSSVSLDDPSDLKTAARLFKLEIPVQVTGDELLLSHFSVARTVDSMPEQAVLGFRTWCGLELQAAALVGMHPKTGRVDESARLPPPAHATPHWVPPEPVPAPLTVT